MPIYPSAVRLKRGLSHSIATLAVAASAVVGVSTSQAQESKALVDALVRKGILSTKEAEEIRAELKAETPQTSASKIKLSNSISELKLYGDLRLRYQYENRDLQLDPPGVGVNNPLEERNPSGAQRSRWRFRLRLNADFKLADNFFGGVELQTGYAADSANQTFQDGFADYPIFISKAYVGWAPTEWLTLTAGKMPNPFYTTELVWDPDVNPSGIAEQIAFHKLWNGKQDAAASGYSKDGKAVVSKPSESRWELTLVAGQFIFDDNDENLPDNDQSTDAYVFETQLIATYKFTNDMRFTMAPAWLVENAASVNQNAAVRDVFGPINDNDFRDNEFVSGATRNLNLLLFPGELAFKVAGIKTKLYWDFSYNIEGRKRAENIYRLSTIAPTGEGGRPDPDDRITNHSNRDDVAFLIGLQIGENKKKGNLSGLVNYRQTGIAAVDPNLNENDFGLGELNSRGFKFTLAYNLTDFAVFSATYMTAWQLRDIRGGEATGGNGIADTNASQVLQVDLTVKF